MMIRFRCTDVCLFNADREPASQKFGGGLVDGVTPVVGQVQDLQHGEALQAGLMQPQ